MTSALVPTGGSPSQVADRIGEAQSAYRDCIADTVAGRPKDEGNDLALAAALEQCREAELVLRAQTKAVPDATAADTLAIVLDTRIDGEEAGLQRRESH
jgi:hypothetical protein